MPGQRKNHFEKPRAARDDFEGGHYDSVPRSHQSFFQVSGTGVEMNPYCDCLTRLADYITLDRQDQHGVCQNTRDPFLVSPSKGGTHPRHQGLRLPPPPPPPPRNVAWLAPSRLRRFSSRDGSLARTLAEVKRLCHISPASDFPVVYVHRWQTLTQDAQSD